MRALLFLLAAVVPCRAAVCNPTDFSGVYGFQLTGTTTIGSNPQPIVSIGRLVFNSDGTVSGVTSINFTGLYLGNPVTGSYEAHTDCSVLWSLQDVSGNQQHFHGTMTADDRSVQFQQTDPGSPHRGVMRKAGDTCKEADFQQRYRFTISGKLIDVNTAQVSGSLSLSGSMEKSGGDLKLLPAGSGTVEVDDDCFVHLDLMLPSEASGTREMKFRGILVDGGKELLGMATDPGTAIILTAR